MPIEKNTPEERFGFLTPNKHVDINVPAAEIKSIESLDESLDDNFENVDNTLPLSDGLSKEPLTITSSEGTQGSTTNTSSLDAQDLSLIEPNNSDEKSSTPIFTESFETPVGKSSYDTDCDSQNENGDLLSTITSTNFSLDLDVDKVWIGPNISKILDKAGVSKDNKIEFETEAFKQTYEYILYKNLEQLNLGCSRDLEINMRSMCFSEGLNMPQKDCNDGTYSRNHGDRLSIPMEEMKGMKESTNDSSTTSEEAKTQPSTLPEDVSTDFKKIMDVRAVSTASKGFAQLMFISFINFHKDFPQKDANTISAKQHAKQDLDSPKASLTVATAKFQARFIAGFKDFFSKKQNPYDKEYYSQIKKLTDIYRNQKLYIHLEKRGIKSTCGYNFRSWRMREHIGANDARYSKILKGDGWFGAIVPRSADFKIITSRSTFTWTKDMFLPIVVFPKLSFIFENRDADTLLNYFSPMFTILEGDSFSTKTLKYKYWKPTVMKEVLEISSFKDPKKLSKLLWIEIRKYVNNHQRNMNIRASDVTRIESLIVCETVHVLDYIALGYIEAFNYLDHFSTLNKHGSNEVYVKAFEFFQSCPVVDYGLYILQSVIPNVFNDKLLKLKHEGVSSLQMVEYVVQSGLFRWDSITIGFLRVVIAFIQSPYIAKFLLRRLLFWVDNTANVDVPKYGLRYRWFKDTRDFYEQVTIHVRDTVIGFDQESNGDKK